MRLTPLLYRQHIDRMFTRHWLVQGKRVPHDTGVEAKLKKMGYKIEDANEFVKKVVVYPKVQVVGMYEQRIPKDQSHPDYKKRPCYSMDNTGVLLEGIDQAQVITKTVVSNGTLPPKIEQLSELKVPDSIHDHVKKCIYSACVYDAEQKKLPPIKDPERPAFRFPNVLSITDARKNLILTNKLLQLIERTSDSESTTTKHVSGDIDISVLFEKEDELIQFKERSHILVTSQKPLRYDQCNKSDLKEIPELYPVDHKVTLKEEHFYDDGSFYPMKVDTPKSHPHTTWLHFNRTRVGNLYEAPVTDEQEKSRALVHTFTVAASYAKQLYGENVKDLPKPIHLNCIQTDGQKFHLGVLELNTLDLDGKEGTKNVWHTKNDLELYGQCAYVGSIPTLELYNPEVFGYINAMYNS